MNRLRLEPLTAKWLRIFISATRRPNLNKRNDGAQDRKYRLNAMVTCTKRRAATGKVIDTSQMMSRFQEKRNPWVDDWCSSNHSNHPVCFFTRVDQALSSLQTAKPWTCASRSPLRQGSVLPLMPWLCRCRVSCGWFVSWKRSPLDFQDAEAIKKPRTRRGLSFLELIYQYISPGMKYISPGMYFIFLTSCPELASCLIL